MDADWDTGFPADWDPAWIEIRLRREHERLSDSNEAGQQWQYSCLRWFLHKAGLYQRGYDNFLDIQVRQLTHRLKGWPKKLGVLRILQLSDLHVDLDPRLSNIVCHHLQAVEADMAVITGDFHDIACHHEESRQQAMRRILSSIGATRLGIYGVLGNHDTLAVGAQLAGMGLQLLNNAHRIIEHEGEAFRLAGVDDAYYYHTANLEAALKGSPGTCPTLLLSHSPQVAPEAKHLGVDLVLSGHTHGGQICLPGGRSLVRMREIPPGLFRGRWQMGETLGYTSTGTGSCHLPIRFNCPPEIVIHSVEALTD